MKHVIITVLTVLSALTLTLAFAADPPMIVPIDKDGVQRVNILAGDYFFHPHHIIVKVNVPVELKVRKEALIIPHDIVIDAPQAGIMVKESLTRDPKAISFTPTKIGTYPMYCSKKPPFMTSHREKGMEGMLEVVE
jgi:plastocyanin domain-containing protein